jgi:hypothetical protein
MVASCFPSRSMIARSAAWSAAVAKLERPRLRVTTSTFFTAIASPTSTTTLAAKRARRA